MAAVVYDALVVKDLRPEEMWTPKGSDQIVIKEDGTTGLAGIIPTTATSAGVHHSRCAFLGGRADSTNTTGIIQLKTRTSGNVMTLACTIDGTQNMILAAAGTAAAKLHVDQESSTGATPVLYLDQGDVSEEMIEFSCTIGTGNAIEAVGAKALTTTHFIKVTITGVGTRYIPAGTIA